MFAILKRLFLRKTAKKPSKRQPDRRRFRPFLEHLEDRLVPSGGLSDPGDANTGANVVDENAANSTGVGITALASNPGEVPPRTA